MRWIASLLLLLTGCASHIELDTKFCSKTGEWLNENKVVEDFSDQKGFDHTFQIVAGTGAKQLSLRQLLRERDIRCEDLTSVFITVESDSIDAFFSFLPLFVFKQLRIRGTYFYTDEKDKDEAKNEVKDEGKDEVKDEEDDEVEVIEVEEQEEGESEGEKDFDKMMQSDEKEEEEELKEPEVDDSEDEEEEESYPDPDEDEEEEEGYEDPDPDE